MYRYWKYTSNLQLVYEVVGIYTQQLKHVHVTTSVQL